MKQNELIPAGAAIVLVALGLACAPRPPAAVLQESGLAAGVEEEWIDPGGLPGQVDRIFRLTDDEGLVGYRVEVTVDARSVTFPVRVRTDRDGRVVSARVVRYPGSRGRGVMRVTFAEQFTGKTSADPIRIGKDVDAVSGATSSSRAFSEGVRRAARAVEAIRNR